MNDRPMIHAVMYRNYKIGTLCDSSAWGPAVLHSTVTDEVTCPGCRAKIDGGRLPDLISTTFTNDPNLPDVAIGKLADWLKAWVHDHGGTTLRDTGSSLALECLCGADLAARLGPTDNGPEGFEADAYFLHQAKDLIRALPSLNTEAGR